MIISAMYFLQDIYIRRLISERTTASDFFREQLHVFFSKAIIGGDHYLIIFILNMPDQNLAP